MSPRLIVLLALGGILPIAIAISVAAIEVSRGSASTVVSESGVLSADAAGAYAIAVVPASRASQLRVGGPAEVFVPTLNLRLPAEIVAVGSATASGLSDADRAWLATHEHLVSGAGAGVKVRLTSVDARLSAGTAVGVRLPVGGS